MCKNKVKFPFSSRRRKMRVTPPILSVNFEIPYFTISGVQVRYLKVSEKVATSVALGAIHHEIWII